MVREDIKREGERREGSTIASVITARPYVVRQAFLLATMNQMTPCPPPPLPGSVDLVVAPQNWQPESRLSLVSVIFGI